MDTKWKPDFAKWYDVDSASYKLIFDQAEKRMEDVLSNSESITDKSIKVITALGAMFTFFIGFLIKKKIPISDNYLPIILFIANVLCALYLLFPKEIRYRGLEPRKLIPKNLDNEEDKGFQEQIVYYSGVVMLQNNIDFMRAKNSVRAKVYLASLLIGVATLIVGIVRIVSYL